jgi:hypothetical protein
MIIRRINNVYSATAEQRLAQQQEFINLITALRFNCQLETDEKGHWPSHAIINSVPVPIDHLHDKITISTTRWRSKGDGSISTTIKYDELIGNPKRLKNRLTEIVQKCREQHAAELERKQKQQETRECVERIDTWLKQKFNSRCKAERYDNYTIDMDIKNGEDGTRMFQIRYNYKTSEYLVQKYCIRTLNNYDWFNQTRIQELKNEIAEYEQALTQAQSIITQMNLDKIV